MAVRLVLQRVVRGSVVIDKKEKLKISHGLVVLVGMGPQDDAEVMGQMAEKMVGLRIFDDENGNLNRSLLDVEGECLIISNFTLYANCRKGKRPSFTDAAPPKQAEERYHQFVALVEQRMPGKVSTGEFGADMEVEIVNDGPVTILLDSDVLVSAPGR